MGYILAGDNKVTITKYLVNRYDNKRGLVLTINTTSDNISLADLDALCENIKANKLDILVYNSSDELEVTLRGFYHNCIVSKGTDGILTAEITNESENTYQIGILQDRSSQLENTASKQAQAISDQNTAISEQAQQLTEQGETIAAQTEQVMVLEATTAEQMLTLDSLLLDVIPAVITDAVVAAVAEALASNPSTDNVEE
jgi:hypothetical protein